MKLAAIFTLIFFALPAGLAHADSKCGNFYIHWGQDGWARINGSKPESQKVTFNKERGDYKNSQIQWMVATSQPGVWLGMDFVIRNGKSILNVQQVQASVDAPQVFGTYDCVKVK